ncbi:SET domain-containing protein SmydA-8-like [Chironomus tepperi]|uniref:SET domain-containing protein SmydA-8-like n=1 Tax=Chironomus tepperi TaxID=113505 RepID=UPI00391F5E2E
MDSEKCGKCGKAATSLCINCKSAFYCSRECQKSDWKSHKNQCRSFEIVNDEKVGRLLRASRDISAGNVLISETPVIIGPKWTLDQDEEMLKFTCVGCFETIKTLYHKCPSCNWPACSTECIGLLNTELHDIECQFLKCGKGPEDKTNIKSIKDYFRMDTMLALKILLLQRKNPKRFKTIMDMISNEKNRLLTSNFKEAEEKIIFLEENFLKPLEKAEEKSGQILLPLKDRKTLHKIFGIIETNAIYINLQTGTEICGLYPSAVFLQHSCLPNITYKFDMKNGFKISVKAARDLKKGEVLTTSFTHVLWPTSVRQQHLMDTKYFNCNCERCIDPTELGTNFATLRCIGSDEEPCNGFQTQTSKDEYSCNKCPIKVSMEHVNMITERMNEEVDNLLAMSPNPGTIEDLIDKLSPFLHPNHYLLFNLKHTLVQLYGNHKDYPYDSLSIDTFKRKLNMCEEMLKVVIALDPLSIRISFYTSILFYEKAMCMLEMHKRKYDNIDLNELKKCLEDAQKIISVEEDLMEGKQLLQKIENALIKF